MPRKASDGIVRAQAILDCLLHLQHHGTTPAKQRLEETEPALAEYLLESLTAIHHSLLHLHAAPAKTRKVYRQVEIMPLVCIDSLRRSHAELWQIEASPEDPHSSAGDSARPEDPRSSQPPD